MAESLAGRLGLALGGLLLCWLLARLYSHAAGALGILDRPNQRSAHETATPTGAGVSFAAIILAGFWLFPVPGEGALALPLLLVAVTGFVDDWRGLPWPTRIAAHGLAAAWLLALAGLPGLFGLPPAASLALWLLALVWLLNLYNFMDGIDGLAAAEAAFVAGGGLLLAWLQGAALPPLLLLTFGAALGFLLVNWPPAKAFMGDVGSGFLGLLFGCFMVTGLLPLAPGPEQTERLFGLFAATDAPPGLAVWLILLGWFLTDASLTLAIRFLRGEAIYEAHSRHAYQHLNRRLGTARTLALLMAVNGLWLLPLAWLAAARPAGAWILVALALSPLLALQWLAGAGQASPPWRRLQSHD